jgi:hypothetical protein
MEFIAVRDFRIRPGKIWKKLKKSKRMLITSNGKPVAMLTDMEGKDLEEELRADSIAKGILALSKMREHAKEKGLNKLKMKEITKEINSARKTF